MILGILIFANFAMTTRLPTRHRGNATLHASDSDPVSALHPEDIPKVNYRKFFNPAYITTVIGASLIMTGITFPVRRPSLSMTSRNETLRHVQ